LLAACARDGSPASTSPTTGPAATSGATGSTRFPVTITDDDDVAVTIGAEPQRIVTFAPSMTEIVFALGLGDRLVGVSGPYDDYPAEAEGIERVGGAGEFGVDPNLERVVALEPDLFLTIAGGDQWKAQLRDLGVPVVTLNATDLDDLLADIRTVGKLTGAEAAADALVTDMAREAEAVEELSEPRVSCFFEVYYGPPLTTVGPNTFIFDLLERAGCDPVTAGARSDYPEWAVEDLLADPPDVYLATPESAKSPQAIARRPGFDAIPAVASGRVVLVDPDLVTRPGPRATEALALLVQALHPTGG
jgi:iron complex transport system substrate-binding protein